MEDLKILILDDESRITEKLKHQLEKKKYLVYTANTPNEGISQLALHLPDILILDVMLPGANGLDLLEGIKKDYPTMEVLMISGYGDMDMVIKALRLVV